MKNLFALLGAAVVVFAGLGWYLDWYKVISTPSSNGHQNISIDVNEKKIVTDGVKGVEKVEGAVDKAKELKEEAKHAETKVDPKKSSH
jgi:hypothetical protein